MAFGRRIAAWACWWAALFWLWMLLAGDWSWIEWSEGAGVAAAAAVLAERVRAAAGVRLGVPLGLLRSALTVPPIVVADFAIVIWALLVSLARRRVVRGRFRARELRAGGRGSDAVARRAWTVLLAGYSPNAYVVDLDPERDEVLLHDLVPWRRSEEPA